MAKTDGAEVKLSKTLSEPLSVLIVEDEYLLAADLEEALIDAGFVTDTVSSGECALALLIGRAITHRALVTDVHLRDSVSGWEVARRVRERDPLSPSSTWLVHPQKNGRHRAFRIVSSSRSPSGRHIWFLRLQVSSTSERHELRKTASLNFRGSRLLNASAAGDTATIRVKAKITMIATRSIVRSRAYP